MPYEPRKINDEAWVDETGVVWHLNDPEYFWGHASKALRDAVTADRATATEQARAFWDEQLRSLKVDP